ncbi:MAG: FtsK/SpoIIIE domain-containing protein, partial [Microbacterium sp.]
REAERARAAVSRAIEERHSDERRRARTRHPDVAAFLTRDEEIWRDAPWRADALVIGHGDVVSDLRVTGGEGDADAAVLRARAARLPDAPVVLSASRGVAVVGTAALGAAVQRALAVQVCLAVPPGELALVGALRGELAWAERMPHRRRGGKVRLALVSPGEQIPVDADMAIARCVPGEPLPPRCGTVLTVRSLEDARVAFGGDPVVVRVEAVAAEQAEEIAGMLSARAERALGVLPASAGPLTLDSLAGVVVDRRPGTLAAVVGMAGPDPAVIDLVADGPHAVVAGVTGAGKSELLITWILALCRSHSTREVTFLLADFKGGTAFDALEGVPHVTGVLTDLDGAGARRAIESLRAEMRWREATIAGAGARDVLDHRVDLPRLVIVVDEFAALLGDHPELHAVFTDVAARGRALGMHLILGTQRASGVIRDGLLTNCPLRVSLRVTDAADSRTVIGTDDAAHLPGGMAGRGQALVRRAGDGTPYAVRVALSDRADVGAATRMAGDQVPRRPWLPPLPHRITLEELRPQALQDDGLLLGLVDEPDRQRQRVLGLSRRERALLVVGGPGSGISNTLSLLAAQAGADVIRVPGEGEPLWDAVADLAAHTPVPGTLIVVDDLDAIAGRLPPDYAHVVLERLEDLLRRAGSAEFCVAAGAHRAGGTVSRLVEHFPRRLFLPFPSRAEHVGAGADPALFDPAAPTGRAIAEGAAVQIALSPPTLADVAREPQGWRPSAVVTGLAIRRSAAARALLERWSHEGIRARSLDEHAADPSRSGDEPLLLVGEPDEWQRHWRLLSEVRGDHDLVIDTSCAAEFRLLAGSRELPPFCESGRGRAWLLSAGADPVRVVFPRPGASQDHARVDRPTETIA